MAPWTIFVVRRIVMVMANSQVFPLEQTFENLNVQRFGEEKTYGN
jgi:hypothetical protein